MSALASLTQNYSDSDDSNISDNEQSVHVQLKHSSNNACIPTDGYGSEDTKSVGSKGDYQQSDSKSTHDTRFNAPNMESSSNGIQNDFYSKDDEIYVPDNGNDTDEDSDEELQNLRENLLKHRDERMKQSMESNLTNVSTDDSYWNEENSHKYHVEHVNQDAHDEDSPPLSPETFHRSLLNIPSDEIRIPEAPRSQNCPHDLIEKISKYHRLMQEGKNMTAIIQQKKSFRNPSIYEKLIAYCEIDEFGSNFPTEVYDPHCWKQTDYYDYLEKRQEEEVKRRERERKERTKIEIIVGTAKKINTSSTSTNNASINHSASSLSQNVSINSQGKSSRKKSKWDVPASSSASGTVGVLINPDSFRQSVDKANATSQSFYK